MNRQALEKDHSFQRKALLRPHFKCTSVDGNSTKDTRNFPNAPGVIRNTGGNLKMWSHLVGAKDAILKIQMVQIETPELKKMAEIFVRRASVLLPPITI